MLRRFLLCCFIAEMALCCAVHAEIPVRFILARQVILADRSPSSYIPEENEMAQAFRNKFTAAFPGQVMNLDNPDQMISPEERVIVIIPTINVARLTDELKAGSVHNFSTLIVGDVSAIDPWTDANLYSGTRMFSSIFQIGNREISSLDATARASFKAAVDKWLDATIDQMRTNLSPFVLDGATLAIPAKTKQFKGGIWPFGAQRGVKVGQTLNGGPGHYAKIVAAFPNYSLITDTSLPSRTIPSGEQYSLTLVDKPTERPEPRVELSWLGSEPSAPEGDAVPVLSSVALVNLFDNYLSKGGGFKVLPRKADSPKVIEQKTKLAQEISARSKLVEGNLSSFERENLVMKAAENPDRRIRIGVLERYHGRRTKPDGTIENYYRLTLAASGEERTGPEEQPLYAAVSLVKHTEELTSVEAAGIRELDPAGTYLTLFRNAVINLAGKVRESAVTPNQTGSLKEAIEGAAGIDWKGTQPGTFTPLNWLRPGGEVLGSDGKSLGQLYKFMQPSQGFLNPSVIAKEKLEPGDVLRYQSNSGSSRPLVAFELVSREPLPAWLPESPWLLRIAGSDVGLAGNVQVIAADDGTVPLGVDKISIVKVAALGVSNQGATTNFTGQWRLQVRSQNGDPATPPILQLGIQSDTPVTLKSAGSLLQPLDVGGWGLDYTLTTLKTLADAGSGKNIKQAFYAPN